MSNKSPDEEVKLRRHHLARCMKNFKTDIYFVSTFEPSTKSVDLLTVETFAGTVCEYADMPKSGQRPEDFMPLSVMKETGEIILTGCVTSI